MVNVLAGSSYYILSFFYINDLSHDLKLSANSSSFVYLTQQMAFNPDFLKQAPISKKNIIKSIAQILPSFMKKLSLKFIVE